MAIPRDLKVVARCLPYGSASQTRNAWPGTLTTARSRSFRKSNNTLIHEPESSAPCAFIEQHTAETNLRYA